MSRKQYSLLALVWIAILVGPATAQGVLTVPGQYSTIQDAINAALDGDTVLVAPGSYVETIDFIGKSVTVASVAGPDVTVIDGNNLGAVVTFSSDEGPDAVLSGFTITRGLGIDAGNGRGAGGVQISGASPTLSNCTIEENRGAFHYSTGGAGAMECDSDSFPMIVDCTFRRNFGGGVPDGNSKYAGPGAIRLRRSSPSIIDCLFDSNVGGDCGVGSSCDSGAGGISGSTDSSPEISGCTFISNVGGYASDGTSGEGGAGGLWFRGAGCRPRIESCIFEANVGGAGGGGGSDTAGAGVAQFSSSSWPTFLNCQFTANLGGAGGPGHGDTAGAGALQFSSSSRPTISDCTFTSNVGGNGGPGGSDQGGSGAICLSSSASAPITRCTFIGNQGGDCSGSSCQGGAGAIDMTSNSSALIRDCLIKSNRGGVGGMGSNATGGAGAMAVSGGAGPRIEGTMILRNRGGISGPGNADPQYEGPGAISITSSGHPTITGCIIAFNVGADGATESDWGGAGALRCSSSGSPVVTNCTIVFNRGGTSLRPIRAGAGSVQSYSNAQPWLTNSILWGNVGGRPYANEISVSCNGTCGHTPVVTHSIVAGGFAGEGNLDMDPLLANPHNGDFHISCASPCVDAGLNATPDLPLTDLDGDDRIYGRTVDIGADEFDGKSLGLSYCLAVANSTGSAAGISAGDCPSLAQNNFVLTAAPVPSSVGIFFYGTGTAQVPLANGFLCVAGSSYRLPSVFASGNSMEYALDLTTAAPPGGPITAGSTWYFQAWYRDGAAGGAGSNLTDGLSITFAP